MDKSNLKKALIDRVANNISNDILQRPDETTGKPTNPGMSLINNKIYAYKMNYMASVYGSRAFVDIYENHEYNLAEMAQMEDTESYCAISFIKHLELCSKSGYHFSSPDQKIINHVHQRFFEIGINTDISDKDLISKIQRDIIKYSNAYIVLVRDKTRTSGKNYKFRGKELEPIAGMFIADPPSIKIKRNENGKVLKYKQTSRESSSVESGKVAEFSPQDVIHITFNQKEGHAYGTPSYVAVVEDVRSLRRIEEMAEMLISSHIFPVYHYIVGTENIPGSPKEVDEIKYQVEKMPSEGALVTNERHQIKVIGAEGKALDVMPYLEYYQSRVLSGLFISEITIGRGNTSNKSTAASLDQALIDRCNFINYCIQHQITSKLLIQFVLDGGFKLLFDTAPQMNFNNLDEESVRAKENHALNMYQSNLITEDEARNSVNRKSFNDDDSQKRYVEKVDLFKSEREAQNALKYAVPKATGSSGSAAKNTTKSKVNPANQYGTKPTKTKRTANNSLEGAIYDCFDDIRNILTVNTTIGCDIHFMQTFFIARICDMIADLAAQKILLNEGLDEEKAKNTILHMIRDSFGSSIKNIENLIVSNKIDEVTTGLKVLEGQFVNYIQKMEIQ